MKEIIGKILGLVFALAIAVGFWASYPILSIIIAVVGIIIVIKA